MKQHLTLLLLTMLATPAMAQKKKAKAKPAPAKVVQPTPRQLIAQYRFGEAITQLQDEIKEAERRRKPTDEMEELLAEAERLNLMLEGAQQIVFVDSVVVDKAKILTNLRLGSESGRVMSYTSAFGKEDPVGCAVYQSQLGNLTFFAQPVDGKPMLHSSNLVGGKWSDPAPLQGLDPDDISQNYPFMLSDGATLYFGAENTGGMGGYDIYFSRYDNEDRTFRQPENAGMPFNSMANDYMLAIDEYNHLGYLVTDRRQPAGKVCIYTFIPPTVRTNLSDLGISEDKLRQQATISSIAATQHDKQAVAEARQRISALGMGEKSAREHEFTFVVNDLQVYHFLSDFRSTDAGIRCKQWQKARHELETTKQQLETARSTYAAANADRRTTLRQQILSLESAYEQTLDRIQALEKEIRNLENKQK